MPEEPGQRPPVGRLDHSLHPRAHHPSPTEANVQLIGQFHRHEHQRIHPGLGGLELPAHRVVLARHLHGHRTGHLPAGDAVRGHPIHAEPLRDPPRGQPGEGTDGPDAQLREQLREPGHPQHTHRIRRQPRRIPAGRDDHPRLPTGGERCDERTVGDPGLSGEPQLGDRVDQPVA
ncbi:hypothetical protein ACFYWO_14650 [Streptomyces sp. NPDC002932]|uniref:hypothetical protein n=1 Tax=Streptomyces sp. NPDC002932 TaxID=3364672 RepID=UPI0036CEA358